MDNWPKLNIIIGSAKVIADKVNTKASLIAKKFGRKKNILLKNFWVYNIPNTAKKDKCKLIS